MINKVKKAGRSISKNYVKLSENTDSIVTGISEYQLEEQLNRKYKYEIREMWMRYDK